MSFLDPIFNDDSIFGNKIKKTSCPSKSDICGNLPGVSVLDNYVMPKCNDINFKFSLNPEESLSGCCVVELSNNTCDTYISESSVFKGDDHDMGIQFLDASGLNPRKICHSAPIRKRVIEMKNFFTIILLSAILIFITAIFGACYEFWLKYGNGEINDCYRFVFKKKCTNGSELSPIDYSFPSSLGEYPYKSCQGDTKLGFPYAIINYFNIKANVDQERIGYKILKILGMPVKALFLNFLYTIIFCRKFINYVLVTLSNTYTKIGDAPILKNIIFLFLTGILFNVIAYYTKIQGLNNGPGFVLYALSMLIVGGMIFSSVITNVILYWWPGDYNKFDSKYSESASPVLNKNFGLLGNIFYNFRLPPVGTNKLGPLSLFNILKNMGLLLLLIIPLMFSFSIGILGTMLAAIYMIFSLIFNIFYVPLSNVDCFLSLIKDHGDLLTILFCVSIVVSSVNNFNSTTSGTIGGLVGLIILYKIYKALTK